MIQFSQFMHDIFMGSLAKLRDCETKCMALSISLVRFQEKLEKEAKMFMEKIKEIDDSQDSDEVKAQKKVELLACETSLKPFLDMEHLKDVQISAKDLFLLKPFIKNFPEETE